MKLFYSSLLAWSGRKSLVSFGENHISVPTSFVVSGCYPGFSWEYFDSWKQKQQQQKICVLGILGRGISKYAKITTSSQGALFSENPEDCEEACRVLDDSSNGLGAQVWIFLWTLILWRWTCHFIYQVEIVIAAISSTCTIPQDATMFLSQYLSCGKISTGIVVEKGLLNSV